jgi:type I restriction-modification system DNA methylase subunit
MSKLTHEELIEKCKELNLDFLTKAKKPKAIKTLISLLNTTINNTEQPLKDYDDNYSSLEKIIDKCHNFLYTKGITGSKAQNDIMKFFTIKIVNHLYNNGNEYIISLIDNYKKTNVALKQFYDNYEGDISKVEENKIDKIQNYLYFIEYLKDISLILLPENRNSKADENDMWKIFVQECLSKIFPDIYSPEDYIMNSKYKFTISNLIEIISKFNINDLVIDELQSFNGDIHEKFLKYQGNKNSKELGQFFTPREIIKAILNDCGFKNLIENLEGNDLSIYDPCLGTGGLLCYTYNSCKTKIKSDNIYGCEIENDTIKLGIVSLMISTNNCNKNIKLCNSLIENPYLFEDKKFDIIFSNPPFGTKTNYKELEKDFNKFKDTYYKTSSLNFKDIYKISANTGINLFIQNIIYLLKIGGIACIILPDGELMIGKSSIKIRKFILDNCRILKIITINSGAFTNTTIKTKALIIQKGNYDNYNQEIEYFDINSNGIDNLGFEKLNKNYQFNLSIVEEEKEYGDDIEIKTLGEVCEINYGTRITKKDNIIGEYDVYGGGDKTFTTNNYNREGFNIIIGRFALSKNCVRLLNKKLFLNDSGLSVKPLNNCDIFHKYLGYYLYYNQNKIYELTRGTAQQNLDIEKFNLMKIPIPLLNKQEIIVEYLDNLTEIIDDNKKKIDKIKRINNLYLNINLIKYEIKTLNEVCDMSIKGNINSKEISNSGEYPFYKASVNNPSGTNNTYCFDDYEYILFIKSGGNANNPLSLTHGIGKVYYVNGKSCGNTEVIMIKGNSNINLKYLYYYLNINQLNIQKLAKYSTNLGHINMTEFKLMKIKIPSLEKQKEIIEYLDYNNEIIKNLENEIEFNKKQAEQIITN